MFAARIDREPAGGVRMTDFQTAAINNTRAKLDHAGPSRRPGWWHLPKSPALPGLLRRHARNHRPYAWNRTARSQRWTTWPKPCKSRPAPCSSGVSRVSPQPRCTGKLSDAGSALAALVAVSIGSDGDPQGTVRVVWSDGEGDDAIQPHNTYMLTDERNWGSGLHGGGRLVHEGNHPRAGFAGSQDKSALAEDGP